MPTIRDALPATCHCERSEAIHRATEGKNGLLRCARNDAESGALTPAGEKEEVASRTASFVGWVERKRNPSPVWMPELMGIASLHPSYECHSAFASRPASIRGAT